MSQQKRIRVKRIRGKSYFVLYFLLLLALMSIFVMSSYAWFTLSQSPRVSSMNVYITTREGLELSSSIKNPEWKQILEVDESETLFGTLRPVTWSDLRDQFYAAAYGYDGRLLDYGYWQPLTDDSKSHFIKHVFYARSSQIVDVSLLSNDNKGEISGESTYVIGTPVWDPETQQHENAGIGAENAIRLGFRITYVDRNGNPVSDRGPMILYEPNYDRHVDNTRDYVPTPNMDDEGPLVSEDRLILQKDSGWRESYPVQSDVTIRRSGDFTRNPVLFHLEPEQIVRIEVYIWLEGQDMDCTNQMKAAQIEAYLRFDCDTESQTGFRPIE